MTKVTKDKKKGSKFILKLFIFLLILCSGLGYAYHYFSSPVGISSDVISFTVENGDSTSTIVEKLYSENLIKNKNFSYYFARILKPQFKSGSYFLSPNMSLKEIFNELTTGKQRIVKLTIPEGLTLKKIAELFEKNRLVSKEDFLDVANSPELLKEYGVFSTNCEGFLYPDTYFFSESETALTIIKKLISTFFEKTSTIEGFPTKSAEIVNLVKLASIVEREYRVKDEAKTIAGVFQNRLDIGMALQSCTTVEYIITEIQNKPHPTRIFYEDLEINNPYNTYIYRGLPPTPICSPGLTALKAVANPEKHDYLYFRLANESEGRHAFSKSYYEHNRNEGIILKN